MFCFYLLLNFNFHLQGELSDSHHVPTRVKRRTEEINRSNGGHLSVDSLLLFTFKPFKKYISWEKNKDWAVKEVGRRESWNLRMRSRRVTYGRKIILNFILTGGSIRAGLYVPVTSESVGSLPIYLNCLEAF